MAKADPPPRGTYHSPLRAKQAASTRQAVLEAGLDLFGRNGWTSTTIPLLAQRAEVSVDTIHSVFGTKSNLLMAVVEVALVGDDEEDRMIDRPDFALMGMGDRAERICAGVRYTLNVYRRALPIMRALREAAASDPVAHERDERLGRDRHELMAAGLVLMLGREPTDEEVDAVCAVASPEVYAYLVEDRGWSARRFEDWLIGMVETVVDGS